MYYVSSDFHLYHKNILVYDKLAYDTVYDYNKAVIQSVIDVIDDHDTFMYLGDFALTTRDLSMTKINTLVKLFNSMPGEKVFIRGNHDGNKFLQTLQDSGVFVYDSMTIKYNNQKIHFVHNPVPFVMNTGKDDVVIHGHTHLLMVDDPRCINACWCNYKQIMNLDQLIDVHKTRQLCRSGNAR